MKGVNEFIGTYRHMELTVWEIEDSPTVEGGEITHWVRLDAGGTDLVHPQPLRADYNGYDLEDLRELAERRIDEIFPRLEDEDEDDDDE